MLYILGRHLINFIFDGGSVQTSWLLKYRSIDSVVSNGVTTIVGMVEAMSTSYGVVNAAGIARVS